MPITRLVATGVVLLAATRILAAATPTDVVTRLNAALLDALKNAETLGYQGRFDRLAPTVTESFDLPFMAEKAVGKFWKTMDEAQRSRWLALFREFTIANLAGNLDRFTGQRFEVLGEEPAANDTRIVRSQVVDPGQENVELNYRLQQTGAGWKVIDVYLKGTVSELALRRSDYTAVLEKDGFDALVATMRSRIDDLAAGRAKRPVR